MAGDKQHDRVSWTVRYISNNGPVKLDQVLTEYMKRFGGKSKPENIRKRFVQELELADINLWLLSDNGVEQAQECMREGMRFDGGDWRSLVI